LAACQNSERSPHSQRLEATSLHEIFVIKVGFVSVAIKIVIHLLIIALVVIIPQFIYDSVESSRFRGIYIMNHSGSIGYPIYISYWMLKFVERRSAYAKVSFILLFWIVIIALISGIVLVLSLGNVGLAGMPRLG
jgi:hypothetical protein